MRAPSRRVRCCQTSLTSRQPSIRLFLPYTGSNGPEIRRVCSAMITRTKALRLREHLSPLFVKLGMRRGCIPNVPNLSGVSRQFSSPGWPRRFRQVFTAWEVSQTTRMEQEVLVLDRQCIDADRRTQRLTNPRLPGCSRSLTPSTYTFHDHGRGNSSDVVGWHVNAINGQFAKLDHNNLLLVTLLHDFARKRYLHNPRVNSGSPPLYNCNALRSCRIVLQDGRRSLSSCQQRCTKPHSSNSMSPSGSAECSLIFKIGFPGLRGRVSVLGTTGSSLVYNYHVYGSVQIVYGTRWPRYYHNAYLNAHHCK